MEKGATTRGARPAKQNINVSRSNELIQKQGIGPLYTRYPNLEIIFISLKTDARESNDALWSSD